MAKDFTIPEWNLDDVGNGYRFYRACGDTHERSFDKACMVCSKRGGGWMIAKLRRHMDHGRLGGNADEMVKVLLKRIEDVRAEFDGA